MRAHDCEVVTGLADSLWEPELSPLLEELDSSCEPLVELDDSPAELPEDSLDAEPDELSPLLEPEEDSPLAEPDDDWPEDDSPAAADDDPVPDAELVLVFLLTLAFLLVLATCAAAVVAFELDESAGSWPEASWT